MFSMNDDPIFAARRGSMPAPRAMCPIRRPGDLVEAIREVGKGGVFLPPAIARDIAFAKTGVCSKPAVEN